MRDQFPGHFKEDTKIVKDLWKKSIFVFDANILLNFYRYSESTATDFLKLLKDNKSRLWLPEQAAYEYLNNRNSVIRQQIDSYNSAIKDLKSIQRSFTITRGHPFISEETKKEFDAAIEKINAEMEENKAELETIFTLDHIRESIADLFASSVGPAFQEADYEELFKEGQARYDSRIPPGYKDGGKHADAKNINERRSNYGDWILWKQLLTDIPQVACRVT